MTDKNKIPKIIHYCWFGGGKKSKLITRCMDSWKKYCPDYEIKEWNEHNFDINCCAYVKEAYAAGKWAFVSDYARLWIIYNFGGIYLDTDVELCKSLDSLLTYHTFFATEDDKNINTGIGFGGLAESPSVKVLLDGYDHIHFLNSDNNSYDFLPCTTRNTESFCLVYGSVQRFLNNRAYGNMIIFSKEYFCPFNHITGELHLTDYTYAIHWFDASWRKNSINIREKMLRPIKRLIGIYRGIL